MIPTLLVHVLRKYYFNILGVVQCQNIHTKFRGFLIQEVSMADTHTQHGDVTTCYT